MGCSVSYATGSRVIAYGTVDYSCGQCEGTGCDYCDEGLIVDDGETFECMVDDFRTELLNMFPSVEKEDSWIGREDHVLAQNKLAQFGMSEYCGLVSYWIVPSPYAEEGLANRWIDSIADRFTKAFGEMTKVGTFSNGETVFQRN